MPYLLLFLCERLDRIVYLNKLIDLLSGKDTFHLPLVKSDGQFKVVKLLVLLLFFLFAIVNILKGKTNWVRGGIVVVVVVDG